MKKKIIASKPYSAHPGDHYLSIVIAKIENSMPYVTWIRNTDDGGFHCGTYHENLAAAITDFNRRPTVFDSNARKAKHTFADDAQLSEFVIDHFQACRNCGTIAWKDEVTMVEQDAFGERYLCETCYMD